MSDIISSKRFRIAFSFAGEKRDFVEKVARILAERFAESAILYDKFHEAEFSRYDLGIYLPKLYREQADLVVAVFSLDYDKKRWTGWEWMAIHAQLTKEEGSKVMLTRFNYANPDGLFSNAAFAELDKKTEGQTAALILERLALNEGKSKDFYTETDAPHRGSKCLVNQNTLLVGELMIDVTEQVMEPVVRRTATRHKFPVYQNTGRAKHVLGGVFFHARFLEAICRSLHVVFPYPTMATSAMDLEDEISKLAERREKWNIHRPQVSRQPYCVRRTFLSPTQEEVLRVDSGAPEQLNPNELQFIEEHAKRAMQNWVQAGTELAVLLADYDLGLFSKPFIESIPRLLRDCGMGETPIVVHSGRSWLKFAQLPHTVIVSDWDEALVDYLRLDFESTIEEFDTNPFSRIASVFPDLRGFVLVRENRIRAGFWRKNGSYITGEDIEVAIAPFGPQPRIGERALVACWLCATLGSTNPERTRIEQAADVLKKAQYVLTDQLWKDNQTQEQLGRVMISKSEESKSKIMPFSTRVTIRSPLTPVTEAPTDGFPGRRSRVVCLYHQGDDSLYRDFAAAAEPQGRTGKMLVESELIDPRHFEPERVRSRLKSSEAILLFASSQFYEAGFHDSVMQLLRERAESAGTLILFLELVPRPRNIGDLPFVNWLDSSELPTSTAPHRWNSVVDRLTNPVPRSKITAFPAPEQNVLNIYKTRRVAMTENLMHYYRAHFPNLCGYFDETRIPVLVEPGWLPTDTFLVSELDSMIRLDRTRAAFPDLKNEFLELLRANDRGKRLFNGWTYRLLKIDGNVFEFTLGRYFDFIKSCESLGYEAAKESLRVSNESPECWAKWILPSRGATHPTDFASRSTAFGTCTLVVVKRRAKEPVFLLNQRSQALAETPGLKHVIPAGTFQPHGSHDRQVIQQCSFSVNIFRELIEELISDEGIRYQAEVGFPDSLTQRGRRFFAETYESGAFELFYLGTVLDPFNLKPEILTVGIFDESSGLLDVLHASWETDESIAKEVFTETRLNELMTAYDFVPTGRAHLHLTKKHFGFLSSRVMS